MKKIVAIDLDGTLLHSDCTISSYSKEVIAEAVKNGIMVVPTSGRSFRSIKNQVQDIEGVKYCICANGTLATTSREPMLGGWILCFRKASNRCCSEASARGTTDGMPEVTRSLRRTGSPRTSQTL